MKPMRQPAAVAAPAMAQVLPFLSSSEIRSRPRSFFFLDLSGGCFRVGPAGASREGAAWGGSSQEGASQVVRAPTLSWPYCCW